MNCCQWSNSVRLCFLLQFQVGTSNAEVVGGRELILHVIKAAVVPKIGHFHLWLRDALCDIVADTPLAKLDIPCLKNWVRVDTNYEPIIPRDVIFASDDVLPHAASSRGSGSLTPSARQTPTTGSTTTSTRSHSATKTHEWLASKTSISQWLSRLRKQHEVVRTVEAFLQAKTTKLTSAILYNMTGLVASQSDIDSMLERVEEGVAVSH